MNKKVQKLVKKELRGLKVMVFDFLPRLTSLLNPSIWQSSETLTAALGGVVTSFVGNRIKSWLEEIKKEDIDENVANSEKSKQIFLDLIKFVAKDNPDTEIWEAAKKIFILTLEKNTKEQERASLYEMLNICRELSGTEIRILAGAYLIYENPAEQKGNATDVRRWANEISKDIGLETAEEVLRYEDNLVKQKLIAPRGALRGDVQNTWETITPSQWHRLTPLGIKFAHALNSKT